MYINFKNYLISDVNKIDILKLSNDNKGNTIFEFNNEIYYPKTISLNEFIGERISEKINLRTVNFECFKYLYPNKNEKIIIASKSFINPTSTYSYALDSDITSPSIFLNEYKNTCLDEDNFIRFSQNIFKMFAVDIYMGQDDRNQTNCLIEKYDTGYTDLAPTYDYTESYFNESLRYENPFFIFFEQDDYYEMFKQYPVFLKLLKKVKSFNLIEIIHDIEDIKGFKLPNKVFEVYKQNEEKTQKKLEKIIK